MTFVWRPEANLYSIFEATVFADCVRALICS